MKIANFTGKLLQNYEYLECEIFPDTFETSKRSFISAFSICMTVPLSLFTGIITEKLTLF